MNFPDFLVVGAAKAGTTSIYNYLKQHPEIYMSEVKEPFFFSFYGKKPTFNGPHDAEFNHSVITGLADYQKLFAGAGNGKVRGECSNSYLYFSHSADNIKKHIPNCKIIIILRNPVDRAFSHYLQCKMLGQETLSFEDALAAEAEREQNNWRWHYQFTKQSLYFQQVKKYYETFHKDQIFVGLFDDLKKDTAVFFKDLLQFLNVSEINPQANFAAHNRTGLPKSQTIHNFLRSSGKLKQLTRPFTSDKLRGKIYHFLQNHFYNYDDKPVINPETAQRLNHFFKEDILKLQQLIDRDLSHWYSEKEQIQELA